KACLVAGKVAGRSGSVPYSQFGSRGHRARLRRDSPAASGGALYRPGRPILPLWVSKSKAGPERTLKVTGFPVPPPVADREIGGTPCFWGHNHDSGRYIFERR